MKKKTLAFLIIGIMVFAMSSCSNNSYEEVEVDPEDSAVEDVSETEDMSTVDGLDLLAWEPNEDNSEGFFLLRNGQNYSLDTIDDYKAEGTLPVIVHIANAPGHGGCVTYGEAMWIGSNIPDTILGGFFSYGDIPVPVLEEGDKVVSYSSTSVPDLQLRKVNYYGNAIRLVTFAKGYKIVDDATEVGSLPLDTTEVKNSSGEVVDDFYNLNEGETYTISWYEGTQYKETTLPADSKFYVPEKGRLEDPDYVIEGSLTKDGYAEYDLSGVAPGTYKIVGSSDMVTQGLITIE